MSTTTLDKCVPDMRAAEAEPLRSVDRAGARVAARSARRARPAGALLLALPLVALLFRRSAPPTARPAPALSPPALSSRPRASGAPPPARPTRVTVEMEEFLRFDAVRAWISRQSGVNGSLPNGTGAVGLRAHGALLAYLPARFEIELDAGLVGGPVGEAAAEGCVSRSATRARGMKKS